MQGRQFDFVVAMDLLDRGNCAEVLKIVYDLLRPGGQVLFYESNPWNVSAQAAALVRTFVREQGPAAVAESSGAVRADFGDRIYPDLCGVQ